ncbi:MAG TPA: DUF3313 domain-containing protein [Thermoanaerobaculia bacterium]|nr:DUF3313 domain-containing protein [Thermoanaerobaculia bacterium]
MAVLLLSGCAYSYQARHVAPTSFLGPSASLLEKGKRGQDPLLVYRRAGTAWSSYDKVIVDPIEIWTTDPSSSTDEWSDVQKLADVFHQTLTEKLTTSYRIVETSQPGAMRIRIAMIDARPARAAFKVAKNVAPYTGVTVADAAWTFITGKPAFGGEVSIEYMIHDSVTGELLSAGADRRVGGDQIGKATFTTWGDAKNIITLWCDFAAYRLCLDRGGKDCRKPRAGLLEMP